MAESDGNPPPPPPPPSGESAPVIKRKTLAITIRDKQVLYAAYMPFLRFGGLFIPTKKYFAMGDELTLVTTLIEEPTKYTVNCKVVWITPPDSQSNKAGGIGVQFADDRAGEELRKRIEEILGILLQSNDATHTM